MQLDGNKNRPRENEERLKKRPLDFQIGCPHTQSGICPTFFLAYLQIDVRDEMDSGWFQ